MDKYSGMNKVETKVSENNEIVKKDKKRGGFIKYFCVQTVVAVLLGGALFVGKLFLPSSAVDKFKAVYCFDTVEYVSDLLDKDK